MTGPHLMCGACNQKIERGPFTAYHDKCLPDRVQALEKAFDQNQLRLLEFAKLVDEYEQRLSALRRLSFSQRAHGYHEKPDEAPGALKTLWAEIRK